MTEKKQMSQGIRDQYRTVINSLSTELVGPGFKLRGQEEFIRSQEGVLQRLAVSLREPPGEDVGYIEVFPGFNFPEVEALAASIQGKKPRAGFITCSLNIGLLSPKRANLEWSLRAVEDVEPTARLVVQTVVETAIPFWNEFSSLKNLIAHFEAGDYRVCRGAEWSWRQIAGYCLIGQFERAIELLNEKLTAAPTGLRPAIESALQKVSQLARKQ